MNTRHKPENPLRRREYHVQPILPADARLLIERYHYAKRAPNTAVACYGLIHRETAQLIGATWWIPPTRGASVAHYHNANAVLSLSRLVIIPNSPTNAASFLCARSVDLLDSRWECLLTFADTAEGHTGAIYRACGWEYLGLSKPTPVWIDQHGRRVARLSTRTRTDARMRELGYALVGYWPKHRFRKVRV